ncbi:MAG: amino acid ABC transporter permease [Akkermansiaceae bacterium]
MKTRTFLLGLLVLLALSLACWQVLASLRYHWNWAGIWEQRELLLRGWFLTIVISIGALFGTIVFGLLLAIGQEAKEPVLRSVCRSYVELIRGTPLLTQLLLGYYVIAAAFHIDNKILAGILLLTSFEAAYMAEILRGGVASIERAQWDASRALGFDQKQTWRFVILPQALRRVLPGMTGQCASLVKDSSLLSVLGIAEFAKQTDVAVSTASSPLEGYLPMALGYLALTLPLSWLARRLEMKWRVV